MAKELKQRLLNAEGRSEFVIAAVCDIRGFSEFSTRHESPDIAMYIKRFYLKLLEDYFHDVKFAKPTGDGLFMIFTYSEKTLLETSASILNRCFTVLKEFPSMFNNDPMINFRTPTELGFGIARGTACCLYSQRQIIDYSGQVLNLAARLNDLARPNGIIIDGAFLHQVIPPDLRKIFIQKRAYIRSIAEDHPRDIFCSPSVTLPSYAQSPMTTHKWKLIKKSMTVEELQAVGDTYEIRLDEDILSHELSHLDFKWPNIKLAGFFLAINYETYKFVKNAHGTSIHVDLRKAKSTILREALIDKSTVSFEIQYVPKPKKTSRKSKQA